MEYEKESYLLGQKYQDLVSCIGISGQNIWPCNRQLLPPLSGFYMWDGGYMSVRSILEVFQRQTELNRILRC